MVVKKILFLIGDFVEDYEIMVFFQVLQMVGYMVYVVCFGKKVGDKIKIVIYDFEGDQIYIEKFGYQFVFNVSFDDVSVVGYDVLVVVGGCVLEYLCLNFKVIELV